MLDSLVRVSRRVNENHFVRIANPHVMAPKQQHASPSAQLCCPKETNIPGLGPPNPAKGCALPIPQSNPRYGRRGYNRSQEMNLSNLPPSRFSPANQTDPDSPNPTEPSHRSPIINTRQSTRTTTLPKRLVNIRSGTTGFQCFPLNNFKYFLTLFSKFFSSFPHGTCSLSVSRQYLALDEIYHPFRVEVPINSTL